jgi:GWxTD domain-containing protein
MFDLKVFRCLYLFVVVVLAGVAVISCSRAYDPLIERGAGYEFRQGYPEVRMTAFGLLDDEGNGKIQITADINSHSLIFRQIEGQYIAEVQIEIMINGIEGTRYSDLYTTTETIKRERGVFEEVQFQREMSVPPGNFEIILNITDESSGRRTSRSSRAYIPDPDEKGIHVSAVQLLGIHPDRIWEGYAPVTAYHVSSAEDSLRFVVQVTNNRPGTITIRSQMIRFEADTTAARPMSFPNYSASSLPYKGIDYRSETILSETRRELEDTGTVIIEFRKEMPERGNYRFEVRVDGARTNNVLFRARDFSVKSENFPHIRNPRELAEPLAYLMSAREYRELMAIQDPDSIKEAVDYFWLSNVGSINRARQVISLYYERVEQANKQFTNFKEGWKTDQGMIYILFGPPWYVTTRMNTMQWSYTYDLTSTRYNYLFERPRIPSEHFPFNNYLLKRNQEYFTIQYQQIQRWKTGQILHAFI